MRDRAPVFFADARQFESLRVYDRIVPAYLGQEARDTLGQGALGVLAHEQSDGRVPDDDLLHAMEEFSAGDGLRTDPQLLFPVTHAIGIGGAVLVACAYEIMRQVRPRLDFGCLPAGKFKRPFIGKLFHIGQVLCQMGFHLGIIFGIVGEFAVFEHQVVAHHEELELFVLFGNDQIVLLVRRRKRRSRGVNKAEYPSADLMHAVDERYHFLGIPGNGREHDERLVRKAAVAGSQKFRRVFREDRQGGFSAHVDFCLQAGGVCSADSHKPDAVKPVRPDPVYDPFDLRAQRQRVADAFDGSFLIKAAQAGLQIILLGRSDEFVFHMICPLSVSSRRQSSIWSQMPFPPRGACIPGSACLRQERIGNRRYSCHLRRGCPQGSGRG